MHKKIICLLFFISFFLGNCVFAQKTAIYQSPDNDYRLAIELFNKKDYGAAQKIFENVIQETEDVNSELIANSKYYSAICATKLFNSDSEYLLTNFINEHPESPKIKRVYFQLGNFQYYKRKYYSSIKSYNKVDIYDLTNEELAEYYFKLGYSYFRLKKYDKSEKTFYEIINIKNKFSNPANYYYAHIAYKNKNYEVAFKSFQKLLKDENFGSIVPYYIIQIYYQQEKYEELIEVGTQLLNNATIKRMPEIERLIGESYYKTSRFDKAIPYLKIYIEKTKNIVSRKDIYQLGYAYYKTANYTKAINNFKKVIRIKDSLSQNAYYHIADCFLKNNQKKFACDAFLSAFKLAFDKKIQEDALFNYAKLSYELSYNPYNETVKYFQKYIKLYPNSPRKDEVYSYLVNLFLTTRNYKAALSSIEKINLTDENLKSAFQRITYYRGVELFNDGKKNKAIKLFNKSLKYDCYKTITAQAYYWKAEAFYRTSNFDSAIVNYNIFLLTPGAFSLPVYYTAHYNIGYSYFKKKNYEKAIGFFRKYTSYENKKDTKIENDAYLRIADCYFVSKKYYDAIEYYDKAINLKKTDTDYAMFQKALSLGVLAKFDKKISVLLNLLDNYPKTKLAPDANYEIANTYLVLNNNEKALKYFKEITDNYPSSSYIKNSMLKTGLIQFNTKKDEQALQTFKKIVSNYPGTTESRDALVNIKNIYIDMDKTEDFFVYVKNLPFANVSNAEQDSITYTAAENNYMNNNCNKAITGFTNYLKKFPDGIFTVNANYYKAECEYKTDNIQEALKGYIFVIAQQKTKFTENSLLKASNIYFELKNYEKALSYFLKLEEIAEYKSNIVKARIGQMGCNFLLNEYNQAIKSSYKLISTKKVSNEIIQQAHLTIAKSALKLDSIALAQTEFEITIKLINNEARAEAEYNLALIQYKLENYKKSEKMIFDLINHVPSYDYWIAKSFILLSDNYIKIGNTFQAKHTLQSIIDNYEGADIIKIAHEKQNAILKSEKIEEQKKAQQELEIKFKNNTPEQNYLFEENSIEEINNLDSLNLDTLNNK